MLEKYTSGLKNKRNRDKLMRWKQFFTPVESINADQAKNMINEQEHGTYTLLDVRQPAEYKAGHLPGAKLIPLPELKDRINEIDKEKPAIVYCAIGGRSRVAAQMLSGNDVSNVYNLSGGFKAWQGNYATGDEDQGLELFSGNEDPEEVLLIAFSLEKGLRDFYLKAISLIQVAEVKELFKKLADIEIKHQQRIFDEYCRITNTTTSMDEFARNIAAPVMEGGISTEEFMQRFNADFKTPGDAIEMAMSIEAQALDLYSRVASNTPNEESSTILGIIASEEQEHLRLLGELFDQVQEKA